MSMVFFVQVFLYKNTASNAAYEAARKAITLGATDADIESAADKVLGTIHLNKKEIVIERTNEEIKVAVELPMNGNSWASGNYFPSDLTIREECTLLRQLD